MPTKTENIEMWDKAWPTDGDEFHQFATERGQNYSEWKEAFVSTFVLPNVQRNISVLEIGCGRGRWSEFFVGKVRSLVLVDISPVCLEVCKAKFGPDAATYILSGGDLSAIEDKSIDFVWSFDVLVHVDAADVEIYLKELSRIMKPGARAFLHHADDPNFGGWRAKDMSAAKMRRMVESSGLITTCQFDSWGPNSIFSVKHHQDLITLVSAPKKLTKSWTSRIRDKLRSKRGR